MTDTTPLTLHKDVAEYVAAIRRALADLTAEERDELTGGLEADLSELVAEQADGLALADVVTSTPAEYAAELRRSAGLPDPPRRPRLRGSAGGRRSVGELVGAWLDRARDRWLRRAESERLAPAWALLVTIRPAWWVLRAWVAVQILDASTGDWESPTLIPSLGHPLAGPILLTAAIVGSVLVGTGRLWPGSRAAAAVLARVVLLALNLIAIVSGLTIASGWPQSDVMYSYYDTFRPAGAQPKPDNVLRNDGARICNIQAYDASGAPLVGVQLFDQDGRPIDVHCPAWHQASLVQYPWVGADGKRWNVFPQPVRNQPDMPQAHADAYEEDDPPVFPQTVRGQVGPVTNPLLKDSDSEKPPAR